MESSTENNQTQFNVLLMFINANERRRKQCHLTIHYTA